MREEQRELARRRLDRELRFYRLADKEKNPTQELLRSVRQALGLKVAEVARGARVNRSVVFRLEESERLGTISLRAMVRMAEAMGCKVLYAVIPKEGQTLEGLAERRKWERLLGAENREQRTGHSQPSNEDLSPHPNAPPRGHPPRVGDPVSPWTPAGNRGQAEGPPWRGSGDQGLRDEGTGC